jgi:hypothetical protein
VGRAQKGSDRAATEATTDQEESADAVR